MKKAFLSFLLSLSFSWFMISPAFPQFVSSKPKKKRYLIKCDTQKANYLLNQSKEYIITNIQKSNNLAKEALQLALDSKDTIYLVKSYLAISYINLIQEKEVETFEILNQALEIAENFGDSVLISEVNNNIGASYNQFGQSENALLFLHKALKGAEGLSRKSKLYNNIGLVYKNIGNLDSAIYFIKKSARINSRNGKTGLARNYANLGTIFQLKGNSDSARYYFFRQLHLSKITGDQLALTWAYSSIANYYFLKEEYNQALLYSDSSLALLNDNHGYFGMLNQMYKIKAKSYFKLDENDSSYLYFNLLIASMDSTHKKNVADISKSLELKKQYELEKNKTLMENHAITLEKEEQKFKIFLLFAALVVIITVFIAIYFYNLNLTRKRKIKFLEVRTENEKTKLLLETKEKELTSNVIQIINRNSTLKKAIENLEKLQKALDSSKQKKLNNVIRSLKSNLKEDTWEEFRMRFEQVHQDFYKNLYKKFPNLTSNEIKLCSFLKLKMSTKEISSITGQSTHAIEVARTRLRKKLKLSNSSISLTSFMDSF